MSYVDLASKNLGPDPKIKIEQGVVVNIDKNGIYNVTPDSMYEATSYVKVKVNTVNASRKSFSQIINYDYEGNLKPTDCGESGFDFGDAQSLESMFSEAHIITNPKIKAPYLTDITAMFFDSGVQYIRNFVDCSDIERADFCFYRCKYLKFIDKPISMPKVESLYCAFAKTNVTLPFVCNTKSCKIFKGTFRENPSMRFANDLNTESAIDVSGMFGRCSSLEGVGKLDFSSVEHTVGCFDYDSCLQELGGFEGLRVSIDLHHCNQLTVESIMNVITNLASVKYETLSLGITNLSKLSDEQISKATEKGWILR